MKRVLTTVVFLLIILSASAQRWQKVGQSSLNFPNGEPSILLIERLTKSDSNTLFAYGENTLIVSRNSGVSWESINLGHRFRMRNLHFFDANTGIAIGDSIFFDSIDMADEWNGLLIKTTDGGNSWSPIPMPLNDKLDPFISADYISEQLFYITSYSFLYRTLDGGKNWQKTNRLDVFENGLNFYNDSIGIARYYDDARIFHTNDGGKTWYDTTVLTYTVNSLEYRAALRRMYFTPDKKYGFVTTANGGGYMTKDYGRTWDGGNEGNTTFFTEYSFYDSINGWTVNRGNEVYKYHPTLIWVLDTAGLNDTSTMDKNMPSEICMINPSLGYLINKKNNKYNLFRYGVASQGASLVKGRVYIELGTNNVYDSLVDVPLSNATLVLNPGGYYTTTDSWGNYSFSLGIGNHGITLLKSYSDNIVKFNAPANGLRNVSIVSGGQTVIGNFSLKPLVSKAILNVTITSNRRRRCFSSVTVVNYNNSGFGTSQNTVVKVKLPQYIALDSASVSYTTDADGNYLFNVGTVPPFGGGSIILYDRVVCGLESIRGLTVCTEAQIMGDGVNYKTDTTTWDSTEVIVNGKCLNGWVSFDIINPTDKDMSDSLPLRFYSNAALVSTRNFKLPAKDTLRLTVKADFTTFRLEADQHKGHPLSKYAQATVEGCEGEGAGNISKGFVNKLPVNDFSMKKHVDCQEITDSYDPNDKAVTPLGITNNNYVKTGTELYYKIRFQNTGTDTAYKVVVRDTLSPHLDLRTFSLGSASHKYSYVIKGQGKPVLEVTFANIYLPDSSTDEQGSNGFFTYKVAHKQGISQGTTITNKADIYFDFNSPITTNTTTSIIKDTVFSNPIQINPVEGLPFIVRSYTQDSVCVGDTFTLALIGNGPYKWYAAYDPSTVLSTAFELKLTAKQTTIFIGETKDGQSAQTVLVKNCKGGSIGVEETQSGSFVVYPNPSKGAFTIYSLSPLAAMEVFTVEGKKVADINNGETEIDLSAERPGIYILIVYNVAGQRSYVKLIKD